MYNYQRFLSLIGFLLIMMFFVGCTEKKNLVGYDPSQNTTTKVLNNDLESLNLNYFSYFDSLKYFPNNPKLCLGNKDGREARVLLRFSVNLPDSSVVGDTILIRLFALTANSPVLNSTSIDVKKLNSLWTEKGVKFDSLAVLTGTSIMQSVSTYPDSIIIRLNRNDFLPWVNTDSTNFGVCISTTDTKLLEMWAYSATKCPKLSYKVTQGSKTPVVSYVNQNPISDTFVVSGPVYSALRPQVLALSNILPERAFLKFDIDKTLFKDVDNNSLDSLTYEKMSINKAELVFFVNANYSFIQDGNYTISPALLLKADSTLTFNPLSISEDNKEYELYPPTEFTYVSGSANDVKVNITLMLQRITSGLRVNHGIVLFLTKKASTSTVYDQAGSDFERVEFISAGSSKPSLRVVYTLPN